MLDMSLLGPRPSIPLCSKNLVLRSQNSVSSHGDPQSTQPLQSDRAKGAKGSPFIILVTSSKFLHYLRPWFLYGQDVNHITVSEVGDRLVCHKKKKMCPKSQQPIHRNPYLTWRVEPSFLLLSNTGFLLLLWPEMILITPANQQPQRWEGVMRESVVCHRPFYW